MAFRHTSFWLAVRTTRVFHLANLVIQLFSETLYAIYWQHADYSQQFFVRVKHFWDFRSLDSYARWNGTSQDSQSAWLIAEDILGIGYTRIFQPLLLARWWILFWRFQWLWYYHLGLDIFGSFAPSTAVALHLLASQCLQPWRILPTRTRYDCSRIFLGQNADIRQIVLYSTSCLTEVVCRKFGPNPRHLDPRVYSQNSCQTVCRFPVSPELNQSFISLELSENLLETSTFSRFDTWQCLQPATDTNRHRLSSI